MSRKRLLVIISGVIVVLVVSLVVSLKYSGSEKRASREPPSNETVVKDAEALGKLKESESGTKGKPIKYGKGKSSIGVIDAPGTPPQGPASFAIDTQGNIYISDNVNSRIQVYSVKGKHKKTIPVSSDLYIHDITVDESGNVYAIDTLKQLLVQYSSEGHLKLEHSILEEAYDADIIRFVKGKLILVDDSQNSYVLGEINNNQFRVFSVTDQKVSKKKGSLSSSNFYYYVKVRVREGKGEVLKLDGSGKTTKTINITNYHVETLAFLTEDRSGNFYIQAEVSDDKENIHLIIFKFDKDGNYKSQVEIPSNYYFPTTRLALCDDEGTIYQVIPTKKGVDINLWKLC